MAFTLVQPPPDASVPATPACLSGRYRLTSLLGRGGFSCVYAASAYRRGERLVAVKRISLRNLSREQRENALHGFQREIALLAALDGHPNLPRLHEYAVEGEDLYLVMDYIAGETLDAYVRRRGGHLPLAEVLVIGQALCLIIGDLHACQPPIVFRDLKPENVLRTPDGRLYLIDFGIAGWFEPGGDQDFKVLGTPGFAPPEQYQGAISPRDDIYALGALLHFLLTGDRRDERPFCFAPLGWQWDPQFARFEQLLLRMVARAQGQRPANMAEVWGELHRLARGLYVRASGQAAYLGAPTPALQAWQQPVPQGGARSESGRAGRHRKALAFGVRLARVAVFGVLLPAALAGGMALSLLAGR
jgi:hypothetical protein